MLALRYHSIGDRAGLGLENIPVPVPATGEVLRLRCAIEREFPLQEAPAAIERSRSGRVQGKLVLVI